MAVAKPTILDLTATKAGPGHGYTLSPKPRVMVGACGHITEGYGTVEWYSDFFSVGGERADDALVDYVVGTDGRIAMLNDPRGFRIPWASGGSDGLEGDGPAFVGEFGVYGINANLASVEHVGKQNDVWPQVQWDASVKLHAWLFDQAGVRWDSYPVHQQYGVVTHMLHFEFATKPCPGPYLKNNITRFQTDVRAALKAGQEAPAPVPSIYPDGMNLERAKQFFGQMRDYTVSPSKLRGFNEKGAISLAWLKRGGEEDKYPEARYSRVVKSDDGTEVLRYVTFGNGWLLIRRAERAGWQWA